MMNNIFNIFDPSTSLKLSMNWISMSILILFLPYQFWMVPSRYTYLYMLIYNILYKEFKILLNSSFSNILIFLSLFTMILYNNFMGLFPYIFTSSSHLSFCLSLSLTLWITMMMFGWINFYNSMFTHLTPSGTPFILMPFMVIIEIISLIIRPITLSIRLSANMIAGHLLLSLIGSSNLNNSFSMIIIMIMIQNLLLILEISVSLIQSYVFSILTLLYSSEI